MTRPCVRGAVVLALLVVPTLAWAQGPNLNARVAALETAVATLQSRANAQGARIAALETTVANQRNRIIALGAQFIGLQTTVDGHALMIVQTEQDVQLVQNSEVMKLNPYLAVTTDEEQNLPLIRLAGVNLQIVNGMHATDTINGLGNLVVGYNESATSGTPVCSEGTSDNEYACVSSGGIWATSHKSGSHNLVTGSYNNYSQYGGFVAGTRNTVNGPFSSVSGGSDNTASWWYGSVSGGSNNSASGWYGSSVSGGANNRATEDYSSVSGGYGNKAQAWYSSVSGGEQNRASGKYSSISGGHENVIGNDGQHSSISGGVGNVAGSGITSICGGSQNRAENAGTVCGGYGNSAKGAYSSVCGGYKNYAWGNYSSISGGASNSIEYGASYSSISGGTQVQLFDENVWAAGGLRWPQ